MPKKITATRLGADLAGVDLPQMASAKPKGNIKKNTALQAKVASKISAAKILTSKAPANVAIEAAALELPPRSVRPEVQKAVLALVWQIPQGQVASYGMLASLLPGVTARMAGSALRGASDIVQHGGGDEQLPWHRVLNASGQISGHDGSAEQRRRLQQEGIIFSKAGRLSWRDYRWQGPDAHWLLDHDISPTDLYDIMADWPR